jgi:hypothetical protein
MEFGLPMILLIIIDLSKVVLRKLKILNQKISTTKKNQEEAENRHN